MDGRQKTGAYTQGPIGSTMLKTAVSMLPGTLAISGYNLADTYFVTQLGTDPLAAMGFTFPVIMLVNCLYRGLGIGVMATTAQALGSKRQNKAGDITTAGILLVMLVSIAVGIAGTLTMDGVFGLFGASATVMPFIISYMTIWYLGSLTSSWCMMSNDLLIAAGSPLCASSTMLLGLGLNVILDPIFMFTPETFLVNGCQVLPFGFGLGMSGAAIATIISQTTGACITTYYLHSKHDLLHASAFKWRSMRETWAKIVRYGVPSIAGMLLMPAGNAVVTWITGCFGSAAVAAAAAGGRLEALAFVFPMSIGIGLMPMIAQNYGAREYKRIDQCRRFAIRVALITLSVMAVVYIALAPTLASFFRPPSEDGELVCSIMITYLITVPFGFAFVEIHRFGTFVYTGCDHPTISAILNAFRIVGLLIPLSLVALWMHSLTALFIARAVSDVIAGVTAWILAKRLTAKLLRDNGEKAVGR